MGRRLHYDNNMNTSVLHSHQIRAYLQYLGYPIVDDPVYSETKIWAHDRAPPVAPAHLVGTDTADSTCVAPQSDPGAGTSVHPSPQLLPRETGKDIGLTGSAVRGGSGVITRLRNMKDEDEDWLHPTGMHAHKLPPQNRRKRGGPAWVDAENPTDTPPDEQQQQQQSAPLTEEEALAILDPASPPAKNPLLRVAPPRGAPTESGRAKQAAAQITCYLPLHPDPPPERLYIFLHALRYTTSLGVFETEMPEWATKGRQWERSS
ncbi:hypothetical protein EDB89DRAFT_1952966 [Lactarius sanguifluus]|nr:hypothetical protein EDB89DRAFT_1952966 [Lactarius sanguifluus]